MLTMGVVWEFLASGYELLPDFICKLGHSRDFYCPPQQQKAW